MAKLLLVDDDPLVIKSLERVLVREGYDVVTCHSGGEALSRVKTETFDLIISDIRMPDISGIETIKKIRQLIKDEHQDPVPEILITGFADEDAFQEAEKLGVADYLNKPLDIKYFLSCVRGNLQKPS